MRGFSILAAKMAVVMMTVFANPSFAGIPVIDGTNLGQNIVTAVEEVAQTVKQVEQYATQLDQLATEVQQYQNMIMNTLQPAQYLSQRANAAVGSILQTVNTVSNLQNRYGNLANYLNQFNSVNGYSNNPCFSGRGCTAQQWATLLNSRAVASTTQQDAYAASLNGLQLQQRQLQTDAGNLEQLQAAAYNARGNLDALGYANQLAGNQSNQLLQIRALLIAQQNALTARMQAEADKEAQQLAASQAIRTGAMANSQVIAW